VTRKKKRGGRGGAQGGRYQNGIVGSDLNDTLKKMEGGVCGVKGRSWGGRGTYGGVVVEAGWKTATAWRGQSNGTGGGIKGGLDTGGGVGVGKKRVSWGGGLTVAASTQLTKKRGRAKVDKLQYIEKLRDNFAPSDTEKKKLAVEGEGLNTEGGCKNLSKSNITRSFEHKKKAEKKKGKRYEGKS